MPDSFMLDRRLRQQPLAFASGPTVSRPLVGGLMTGLVLAVSGCASITLPALPDFQIPDNDPSFRTRVYAGAALGSSNLDPATGGTVYSLDDGNATATQLRVGVDVHNLLAVELESSVLGTAALREADLEVDYSAASVSALVYGLGGVQMRSRREGWSAYGRLGYGSLSRSSRVVPLDGSSSGAVLGLGAEYGFDTGLGIRGEITRYDSEAIFAGIGAVYRFGVTPREVGRMLADVARPALTAERTQVGEAGRTARTSREPSLAAARPLPERAGAAARSAYGYGRRGGTASPITSADIDGDSVVNARDRCPGTPFGTTIDQDGCGLFDAVLGDVAFKSGSWWLNARARGALDEIADKLLAFPEVRIDVQAHTDADGAADRNLALSARRAEAVVQYLRSRGISELQLESRGLGETQPLASNDSAPGRKRNRRIELVTLPNLSPAVLAGRAIEGSVWHYPLVREAEEALDAVRAANQARIDTTSSDTRDAVAGIDDDAGAGDAPALAAAMSAPASVRGGVPPIAGLTLTPVPAPGYVAGFRLSGVIDGLGFDSGSDRIAAGSEAALAALAAELDRFPTARIAVMAHTDGAGERDANMNLSQARARRVVDGLRARGIAAPRLIPEGYGDTLPLVQDLTEADRARNRRVEVRVLR